MYKKVSISTENFIKTLYHHSGETGIKTGELATLLNISPAATTEMVQKLADKKLVSYQKYKPVSLTNAGKKKAIEMIRKHRLWETFLHEVLGLSFHEIHREAEMLEHMSSDFLTEKISSYLGHPETDPHGDPIPAANGKMAKQPLQETVAKLQPGSSYEIKRISGRSKEFFDFCRSLKLNPGEKITIRQRHTNGLTEIKKGQQLILLPENIANHIYAKPITS